jgi:hypothetical protein
MLHINQLEKQFTEAIARLSEEERGDPEIIRLVRLGENLRSAYWTFKVGRNQEDFEGYYETVLDAILTRFEGVIKSLEVTTDCEDILIKTYNPRMVVATASVNARGWNVDDRSEREWQSGIPEALEHPKDMSDFLADADEAYHATKEEPSVFGLKGELWRIDGELVDLVFADESGE